MDAAVPAQGLQLLGTTACPAHEGVATWLHAQLVPEPPESSSVVISSRLANDPRCFLIHSKSTGGFTSGVRSCLSPTSVPRAR